MKLRIYKNSLRIRLDDDDLAQLTESGRVTEELRGGPGPNACLVYSVETRDGVEGVSGDFGAGRLRVFIRPETVRNLADETEVAVEATQTAEAAPELRILVEKEFLP